jgi:hypothetical protein
MRASKLSVEKNRQKFRFFFPIEKASQEIRLSWNRFHFLAIDRVCKRIGSDKLDFNGTVKF